MGQGVSRFEGFRDLGVWRSRDLFLKCFRVFVVLGLEGIGVLRFWGSGSKGFERSLLDLGLS